MSADRRPTSDIVTSLRRTVAYSALERDRYLEAADRLAEQDAELRENVGVMQSLRRQRDAAEAILAPLHDAWEAGLNSPLTAQPPCPTCGEDESTVLLCGACGNTEPVGYDGTCCTWPMMLVSATDPRVRLAPCPTCGDDAQVCDPETGWMACPDCPGVQPFAEWCKGLVALWEAVWDEPGPPVFQPAPNGAKEAWVAGAQAVFRHLRQIGSAR